jgi:plastocyanin
VKRLVLIALCAAAAACSKSEAPRSPAAAASLPPAATTAGSAIGSVAGSIHATGTAVVVLESKTARTFPPQSEKPVMDQEGLSFGPELLLVRTGQPVEFRNNDDTLHNVHVSHEETREPAFNVAIPTGGAYTYTFARDGFYRVGCDIHPSMAAAVFAASTPYTTLADSSGNFTFDDVPAGSWTVTVYADGKRLHKDVEVTVGVTTVTVE